MDHPDSSLPKEVAAVLYYTSIAAALGAAGPADFATQRRGTATRPALGQGAALGRSANPATARPGRCKNFPSRPRRRPNTMSNDPPKPEPTAFAPPVSAFVGPIAELVGHRLLSPPTRPGLLATLARYEVLRVLGGGGMGSFCWPATPSRAATSPSKWSGPNWCPIRKSSIASSRKPAICKSSRHNNVVPVLEVSDRAARPLFCHAVL